MSHQRNVNEKMSGLLLNLVNRLRTRLSQREDSSGTLFERIKRADAALQELRYARAEQIYRSVLREHPLHARAQTNLAIALSGSGRAPEAVTLLRQALEAHPDFFDAWFNLAIILHIQGDLEAAISAYEMALFVAPASIEARRNLSMLKLVRGEMTDANWRDFAWRRLCDGFVATPFNCQAPLWRGEPLASGTIAVYGEQGIGDEILYASCYPRLIAAAQGTLIACNDRLEPLFRRSFGAAKVLGLSRAPEWQASIDAVQFQVPSGDLMRYYWSGQLPGDAGAAYLRADPEAIACWRERLASLGNGFRVGISWRGGTDRSNRDVRSLDTGDLGPLLQLSGIHWVSLQYDSNETELQAIRAEHGCQLHHWQDAIDDYDQTAALVASLDLVISVATSVVHLAGALGQTVWVLVNAAPRWCYMHRGVRLPWYASAQAFRQPRLGDWATPVAECALTLRNYALDKTESRGAI